MYHEFQIVDTARVLGIVLAGGDGRRIWPLSDRRAKPAISIGGTNLLIDIMLSNLLNSSVTHTYVAVQSRPHSLMSHLEGYHQGIAQMRGQFIRVLTPPDVRDRISLSDADSLVQLRPSLDSAHFDIALVVMADQVVKVDFRQVIQHLLNTKADAVMVYHAVPLDQARGSLGVFEVDAEGRVLHMDEKPFDPKPSPVDPSVCFGNLAMYAICMPVFHRMLEVIARDFQPESTLSTSGIPWLIANSSVVAYDLMANIIPGVSETERGYFADTGTIDSWFAVQMDMCRRSPAFNCYDPRWPIYSVPVWPMSAAKCDDVHMDGVLLGWDVICQDGVTIHQSVVTTGSVIERGSTVTNSVILNRVQVGSNCVLDRVIIDEEVVVPDGTHLSPETAPSTTILFADAYNLIRQGRPIPPNSPVLSDGGILVLPIGYTF